MLPSYHNMQLVMINRQYDNPECGDVILFECQELDAVLIKRIVAGPGDSLMVVDGKIWINDVMTDIPWEESENRSMLLAFNEYFVVGDNYSASIDSRSDKVGTIQKESIIGKVY